MLLNALTVTRASAERAEAHARTLFGDASAQLSRAASAEAGISRSGFAEAGQQLLDQAQAEDLLALDQREEADNYDKGFNREVVVLRSDCIRHQAVIDHHARGTSRALGTVKQQRSKLRRKEKEVESLQELKRLTAASADAMRIAASPTKLRQAKDVLDETWDGGNDGEDGDEGNAGNERRSRRRRRRRGREGAEGDEGDEGDIHEDDDGDDDDGGYADGFDDQGGGGAGGGDDDEGEEVGGFVDRLDENRRQCEAIQADLDTKIGALLDGDMAAQLTELEESGGLLKRELKEVRRLVAFKASHGLLSNSANAPSANAPSANASSGNNNGGKGRNGINKASNGKGGANRGV